MAAEPVTAAVRVEAPPEVVFDYFVDPSKLVRWMGDHAEVDPSPDGRLVIDINGVPVRGRVVEIARPSRIVLAWGHAGSDAFPPGSSTVEITLTADGGETVVSLVHRDIPDDAAPMHAVGWRHFLDRLAVAAAGGDPGPDAWATDPPH